MKLAIASGKGGTGKTTVSVGLALSAESAVTYLDCDVEEPNGKLFLQPEVESSQNVSVPVPVVNRNRCTGCGDCADICQFNAIVTQGEYAMVFPELCHSCGGVFMSALKEPLRKKCIPLAYLTVGKQEMFVM